MNGKWITCDSGVETPMFRKVFSARGIRSAEIDIAGLGYFTLLVNGRRVTDERFTPAFTNYGPRDMTRASYPIYDEMAFRTMYMRYDIASLLRDGENILDVIVGNGWFRQLERVGETDAPYGDALVAAFELRLTDDGGARTILTDGTEKCFVYPILKSNIYRGERWDTRLFERMEETAVRLSDFRAENLTLQTCPSDRVIRVIHPKYLGTFGGKRVFDAGENISGAVRLTGKGQRGAEVTLRFAEVFDGEKLDFVSAGSNCTFVDGSHQIQQDSFILSGEAQTLEPMFAYHGFRYFEMEGATEGLVPTVLVIHTDLPVTTRFRCDNEQLNWLYDAYIRTQLDNIHGCVPSDCPQRERLGYTGDGQCCAETALLTLDSAEMYRKWIEDILDCQDRTTGHVQHTAPLMGGGGGPGGWGCAVVFVPWQFYRRTGDVEMLRHTFPAMKKWLSYMQAHCEAHLVVREEKLGWCLGDWAMPGKCLIPEPFVNTCYLIKITDLLREIAEILGEAFDEDPEPYRQAVYGKYFDGTSYCGGIQGADAFAIWANLPESDRLLPTLCERYERIGTFDTGFLCTDILSEVLFENGHGDLAVQLMASDNTEMGFNFMRSRGATTIYEYLDLDIHSLNHPMFGACVRQLFTGLLGIKQRAAGWKSVVVEPALNTPVRSAEGQIETPFGAVSVSFDEHQITVTVPHGLPAALRLDGVELPLSEGKTTFRR